MENAGGVLISKFVEGVGLKQSIIAALILAVMKLVGWKKLMRSNNILEAEDILKKRYSDFHIIHQINEKLFICSIGAIKVILKQVDKCFPYDFVQQKARLIESLKNSKVLVAGILDYFAVGSSMFEVQEYIEGIKTSSKDLDSIVSCLAHLHCVTKGKVFPQPIKNIRYLHTNVCGRDLDKILLGFKEKYSIYPKQSLESSKISNVDYILEKHSLIFEKFEKFYGYRDCVIHNDLTSNNVIVTANHEPVFIDFDFAITSSRYVDFVDIVFTRTLSPTKYLSKLQNRGLIAHYIDLYNCHSHHKQMNICYHGVALMVALKLFTYFAYLKAPVLGLSQKDHSVLSKLFEYVVGIES